MNQTMEEEGHLLNVVAVTQEVMTELDKKNQRICPRCSEI